MGLKLDVPPHGSDHRLAVVPIAFMLLWRNANMLDGILETICRGILGVVTWLVVTSIGYGRVNLDTTRRNARMLAGNLLSILTGWAIHAICSLLWPQNYDWETAKVIAMVEKDKTDLPSEEFMEEKLMRAKARIVRWGIRRRVVANSLAPSNHAIATGTVGSAIIVALPEMESWQTIQSICVGIFTNDRLMEKIQELNVKLQVVVSAIPEADGLYLLEVEKTTKLDASEQQVVPA